MGAGAAGVHDALGNALVIEMGAPWLVVSTRSRVATVWWVSPPSPALSDAVFELGDAALEGFLVMGETPMCEKEEGRRPARGAYDNMTAAGPVPRVAADFLDCDESGVAVAGYGPGWR
jgi:hypothetical protein